MQVIKKSSSRQLTVNLSSTIISYVVQFGISFFLTPFIVRKLGTAAYGFIGLSNSIIGYATLLTVALNSMSGRYITLRYHEKNYVDANLYLSSTFFSNQALGILIILILGLFTYFLEFFINIPPDILLDVKLLFTLTFINSAINLFLGIYDIGLFIKNRLELGNIRTMLGNIFRAILIIIAYGFFPAHLWYIGLIAIICSLYSITANYIYFKKLVPELSVRRKDFRIKHVFEMTKAGAWNILTSLSAILNQGMDLLLVNVFISAAFMGILSISKSVTFILLSLFAAMANTMHPEFILHYAEKRIDLLNHALLKSIRILGMLSSISCASLLIYGDIFYYLWLNGKDYHEIYILSSITTIGLIFSLPTQSLWYIFTMTKRVKESSINLIKYGLLNIALVILAMFFLQTDSQKLYAIVIIQSTLLIIRYLTFLPIYGSKVIEIPKSTFYKPIIRLIFSIITITFFSFIFKLLIIHSYTWITLALSVVTTCIVGLLLNYWIILTKSDRTFIMLKIQNLLPCSRFQS